MKIYKKIDKEGYYIEDVVIEPIHHPEEFGDDGEVAQEAYEEYPEVDKYHILRPWDSTIPHFNPRWDFESREWVDEPTAEQLEELENNKVHIFNDTIEDYIYSRYSKTKQIQDDAYYIHHLGVIKALSESNKELSEYVQTETIILSKVLQMRAGKTLDEVCADVPETLYRRVRKLIKVSMRKEWADETVEEFKTAMKEAREPILTPIPTFDKK